ncbi:divalent-cation tolerance protein CutA [Streptomyces sp. ST2-7A]|uniref:divalent-cation tolerance protein CutA n=1 Tax=Streptomyces sp. ST2-7A TaxID=2907214 RepID=UPI001F2EF800|nr:divalent-cation tolerance protein CutA [Streptomyces sp. ST2-7A]MCE7079131.1 divalent-cation tolerance protein CutA [Streptomyces sp. ST2-7A]
MSGTGAHGVDRGPIHRGRPGAEVLVVFTTTDSAEAAEELAAGAVERRLAACGQVGAPITSVYRWRGEVRREREWQVSLKTTAARWEALRAHLEEAHSYDEPEIIALPVAAGTAGYLAWVAGETSEPADAPAATGD